MSWSGDMKQLAEGLSLLYQSDPCVEISTEKSGGYTIAAAGEVHLQKCLDDLRNLYVLYRLDSSQILLSIIVFITAFKCTNR